MVRIQVRKDGDRIAEARFKVFGCSAAIASASLVAEWLEGSTVEEASRITPERIVQTLSLPAEREYVARMATDAAREAMKNLS